MVKDRSYRKIAERTSLSIGNIFPSYLSNVILQLLPAGVVKSSWRKVNSEQIKAKANSISVAPCACCGAKIDSLSWTIFIWCVSMLKHSYICRKLASNSASTILFVHSFFVRNIFCSDKLIIPGKFLKLKHVAMPIMTFAPEYFS